MTTNTPLRAALLGAALATSLTAQTFSDGYAENVTSLPQGSGQALAVGDDQVYFTGTDLVLRTSSGTRNLLTFATKVFGSFTIRAGANQLLFGESSNGGIWLVPLTTGQSPRQLATVPFNYSATMYGRNTAILSAKTGGFAAKNNDILALDLTTGTTDPIAVVPGASGPIVSDGHGNLIYVTASASFPPPKGSSSVVQFSAAKVRSAMGSTVLGVGDAAVLFPGLDSASAAALDGDQDLFVADWANSQIVEISDLQRPQPKQSILANYSGAGVSVSSLSFVRGSRMGLGLQEFEPYQPAGAGALTIHESAFGSTSQLRRIVPRRAIARVRGGSPVPPNQRFAVEVGGAAPNVMGFVVLGIGDHLREVAFHRPVEAPIFWSATLLQPLTIQAVQFDSQGRQALPLFNPGFASPLTLTAQAYFETSVVAGSSNPTTIVLR